MKTPKLKTLLTIKSILDGLLMYWVWYAWVAFAIWLGIRLINEVQVGYWQCFGAVILFRQTQGLLKMPNDRHVKDPKLEEKKPETTEKA